MKNLSQLLAATKSTMKLSAMLDEAGQKWVISRYKEANKEIDESDRGRKIAKAKEKFTIATATADVFGDVHAEQQATVKMQRSMKRTERWAIPHDKLDIDDVLAEMPELYQQYRQYQQDSIKQWNPGIKDESCTYNPNWLAKSKEARAKARKEFEKEVAFSEKVVAEEEKREAKNSFKALVAEIQPSLF
jgi:hypothetical protein